MTKTCGKNYYFLDEHTITEQSNSISDYLPDDETFESKRIQNTNLRNMLNVFSSQLKSFEEILNVFTNEMSPECADQLISEWERMLSIPDDCFLVEGVSLEDRQRNALIKLAKMNVQTTEDFKNLADSFGVDTTVQGGIDYANETGHIFPGGDEEARFTIVITFVGEQTDTFPYTFPFTFGSGIISLLECVFKHVKPANCNVLFFIVSPKALVTDVYPIINTEESPMGGSIDIDYISVIRLDFETPITSGIIEVEEITLENILIEYSEEESPMAGTIEVEEITLAEILIEYEENEEPIAGTIEVEEMTLIEVLISYSEEESPMAGTIEVEEITLTTI